jgi:UDP-N-acetylmuramate dehydrogenase
VTPTFADLTTIKVGGPISHFHEIAQRKELTKRAQGVFASGEPWMVLGGGSNLVVSDEGFDGHVFHMATKGKKVAPQKDGSILLTAQAGENWDDLVAYAVTEGFQGLESLSGIPGLVGASVIQNIGAYGYDVSNLIEHFELLEYPTGSIRTVDASELKLGLRTSALRTGELRGIVLSVTFRLAQSKSSLPIAYQQVADALDLDLGAVVPLGLLRKIVLGLRSSKGMVLNERDLDSRSCGSFFINPVVSERFSYSLPADAPRFFSDSSPAHVFALSGEDAPSGQEFIRQDSSNDSATVKLSAAWLIEHAGVPKGFSLPGNNARVSTKHTLAITNPGKASANDVFALARYIQTQVANSFGVVLEPEPTLLGIDLG